jgi:rhodanese-related sulfurtransferase
MRIKVTLLFFFLVSFLTLSAQKQDSEKYENIGPEDFLSILRFKENVILLDVRLPFEYRKEKIEGAINMPVARKFRKKAAQLDKEALILVYCTTDVRSGWAAEKLYELGFLKIYNLEGGIEAWKGKGLAVIGKKSSGK